ncbi:non-ribosomal peptide synthetase [Paenibacillus rhizophilus]|uniref:Amino acid adenylation domain-containing protein n=1 Tax=Paenibacillus rhizophilus TaxID=1850366 RepID=A0A3N9P0F1_9BACL|nr:non-ribosomal peptide synthetase [Paenibacillus rhizophilus]RQW09681.1 amino acid adenylation domain-containing protein [Paenibacillus rhizophilus]
MESFNSLSELLKERSSKTDKGVYLILNDLETRFISYGQLYSSAHYTLSVLQDKGMKPGDELLFQVEDPEYFLYLFWACILGGIVAVPVLVGSNNEHKQKVLNIWNYLTHPYLVTDRKSLQRLLNYMDGREGNISSGKIQSRAVLLDEVTQPSGLGQLHVSSGNDIAFVQFSSGSTGDPKGVILTQDNLLANINAIRIASNVTTDDRLLSWMPLTHDMGMIGCHLVPVLAAIDQYIMPTSLFIRHPTLWLKKASEHKASLLASPNFGYKYILGHMKEEMKYAWDLSGVRLIFNGAEPISVPLAEKFMNKMQGYGMKRSAMFPVYGLAEASLGVTIPPVAENIQPVHLLRNSMCIGERAVSVDAPDDDSITFVDVGSPIRDCEVRISGKDGESLSDWTIGYIHIRGRNVTHGYYGNPTATKDAICDGWLNTGDLGLMRNGRLVITGRAKDIIFVNGQNYYPHDFERVVEEFSGILHPAAVCSVIEPDTRSESIYIFIQFKEPVEQFVGLSSEVHKAIHSRIGLQVKCVLPIHKIPKTTSGKIQRYQLAERIEKGEFDELIKQITSLSSEQEKQETECLEETLSPVESELLAMARSIVPSGFIGPDTNLLEAGLDSLKLQQLLNLMEAHFNVRVATQELFEHPNIRVLSSRLEELLSSAKEEELTIDPVGVLARCPEDLIPLSSPQKRLFILQSMNQQSLAYNNPMGWMLEGSLSLEQLEKMFRNLISRHEAWRTSFLLDGDEPMQRIHKPEELSFHIDYVDMEGMHSETSKFFDTFVRPFELAQAPLVRVKLVRLENRKHLLMMDAHHLVVDGTSRAIFIKEFIDLAAGRALPPVSCTYKEYVAHQQMLRQSEDIERQREYWLNRLSGTKETVFRLPSDNILPQEDAPLSRTFRFHLSKELVHSSKQLAARHGMTLFMILFAAYAYILGEYNGHEKVVVGVPTSGRRRKEWESVIGMFAGTLPILCQPASRLTVREFLQDIRKGILEAFDNQLYPLEDLIQDLNLQRDAGKNPLFETLFVFQNMEHPVIQDSELRITPLRVDEYEPKFELAVEIEEEEGAMQVKLRYDAVKYEHETIERIGAHFIEALKGFVKDENMVLGQFHMLPAYEKKQLLSDFQGLRKPLPAACIQEMLNQAAIKYPEHLAVATPDLRLTYKELHRKANRLARKLHSLGVKPGSLIGLMTGRTAHLGVGIVGILNAGCAFVPIDPGSPAERTERILTDSACSVIVTHGEGTLALAQSFSRIRIDLDEIDDDEETSIPPTVSHSDDLVYSIYTSGSTGTPKGVLLENRGLVNYVAWLQEQAELCVDDRAVLVSSYAFDLGYTALFSALTCGCELHIVPQSHLLDPSELLAYLEKHRITYIKMTPSLFHLLVEASAFSRTNLSALRLIILGGEPIQVEDIAKYYRAYPNARIMNHYGPTECTIGCIAQSIEPEGLDAFKTRPTLGNPIANTRIHVLDSECKLLPIGIPGEIYIGGVGVARGYNDPSLTEQAFLDVDLRYNGSNSERLYRTGDLGRYVADGRIEFLGRIDSQVKIRGYRVELAEIENRLNQHPDIRQAVVISRSGPTNALELCAYVAVNPVQISMRALRGFLASHLPEYMVPARFIQVEAFPINENGKINRKLLPDPVEVLDADEERPGPQSDMERQLLVLWREVLQLEGLGIYDHFFEVGGNSLLAVKLHQKIEEQLPGRMKVVDLFAYPTISLLAYYLTEKEAASPRIEPVRLPDVYYNVSRQAFIKSVYKFTVPEPMHTQIKLAAAAEDISVEQICLSVFAYLFHEITKQERIGISAVTSQVNRIQKFTISFDQISGLQGLFKWIRVPMNMPPQEDCISSEHLSPHLKDSKHLFPLFYVDRLFTLSQQWIEHHGITLAVNRSIEHFSFICEFNADLLDQKSVAALFRRYLELLHRVGKFYNSSVSVEGAVSR